MAAPHRDLALWDGDGLSFCIDIDIGIGVYTSAGIGAGWIERAGRDGAGIGTAGSWLL